MLRCLFSLGVGVFMCAAVVAGEAMPKYFTAPLRSHIVSLDPTKQDDLFSQHILLQVYESLFGYNDAGDVIPVLLDDWRFVGENEYVFVLKKGVLFHNKEELTSDDVIASFEKVLSKDGLNWWALEQIEGAKDFHDGKVSKVRGLRKIDKYTVQVKLAEPFAPFIKILTSLYTPIMPAKLIRSGHDFERYPVGAGPYTLKEYDDKSDEIILNRFDQYHGKVPSVEKVKVLTGVGNSIELFNNGKLDFVSVFNKEDASKVKFTGKTYQAYQYGTWFVTFNLSDPQIHPNIRKALYYGIDKTTLASKQSGFVDITDNFIPTGLLGSQANHFSNHYNIDEARRLISGVPFDKRTLKVFYPEKLTTFPDAVNLIKDTCKNIGLNCTHEFLSMRDLIKILARGEYQAIVMHVSPSYRDTDAVIFPSFYSKSSLKYTNLEDPIIDDLLQKARTFSDNKTRSEYYRQLDDYLCSQAMIIPLFYENAKFFFAEGFDGFNAHGMNIYDFQYKLIH